MRDLISTVTPAGMGTVPDTTMRRGMARPTHGHDPVKRRGFPATEKRAAGDVGPARSPRVPRHPILAPEFAVRGDPPSASRPHRDPHDCVDGVRRLGVAIRLVGRKAA